LIVISGRRFERKRGEERSLCSPKREGVLRFGVGENKRDGALCHGLEKDPEKPNIMG